MVRSPVLVGGLALITLLGGAAGYLAGDRLETVHLMSGGDAAPLAGSTPEPQLPRKTPEPYNLPALRPGDLDFATETFSVQQDSEPAVRLSADVPAGWQKSVSKRAPGEVRFLDSRRERGVRIESGFPADLSTREQRELLTRKLEESQPYENDLQFVSRSDDEITGADGRPRVISTLAYTYIPGKTTRYVMVRWVATRGDSQATVEMSVNGLPQDAKALSLIADQVAKSVTAED